MTTYSTSFDSYTADVQPSDWTARWVTANATWLTRSKASTEGGKVLENVNTASTRHLLTWDAIDADANRANCEVLARVRTSALGSDQLRLVVQGSGAAAAETSLGVKVSFNATTGGLQLYKAIGGTETDVGTGLATLPTAINTWYYVRFRRFTGTGTPQFSEDFETSSALTGTWTRSTTWSAGGTHSLQSPAIGNSASATATLTTTVTGSGQYLLFDWKVSSELNFDKLTCTVNGTEVLGGVSGEKTSTMVYPVSAGALTVNWTYTKDGSSISGSDAAWIDNVKITDSPPTLYAKMWADGEVEPSAWQVSVVEGANPAAGWVGISSYTSTGTHDIDWFGVGTNGDAAPPPNSTTTIRTSQVVMEAGLSPAAPALLSQVVMEAGLSPAAPARLSQVVTEVAFSAPIAGLISQVVVEVAFSSAAAAVTQQPRMIVLI